MLEARRSEMNVGCTSVCDENLCTTLHLIVETWNLVISHANAAIACILTNTFWSVRTVYADVRPAQLHQSRSFRITRIFIKTGMRTQIGVSLQFVFRRSPGRVYLFFYNSRLSDGSAPRIGP